MDIAADTQTSQQTPDWSQYSYQWRPWRQQITDFASIVEGTYPGSGTPSDPFIVKWLDNDPEDPQTYSTWFKFTNLSIWGLTCFCVTLSSSAYTAVAGQVTTEFNCSRELFLLGLSFMLLGFAVGPLLFAPLSEAVGRRNVVLITLAIHTLWAGLCCVAQNIQTLVIFRLFCGIFGSPALVITAGQLADIIGPKERGLVMTVFAAAPWLGPTLSVASSCAVWCRTDPHLCQSRQSRRPLLTTICRGPSLGGYLGLAAGWRWLMGFLALFAGLLCILGIAVMPETYAPILLRKRAQLLSKVTGKCYTTAIDVGHPESFQEMLKRSMTRPLALLVREPIVLLLSVRYSRPC